MNKAEIYHHLIILHILTIESAMSHLQEINALFFDNNSLEKLNNFVLDTHISSIFVLVDDNTKRYCLDAFNQIIKSDYELISIKSGEQYKTLETCSEIWNEISQKGADRKSLLINLGGGVITDIGGFCASCFRRGINFIHIPTTLLGMVDASLGGKNGVDFMGLKNQIGVIRKPEMILVETIFLKTLPKKQLISGFAEMIKHGLISSNNKDYFEKCIAIDEFTDVSVKPLIKESIEIKLHIVEQDIEEKGLRKTLNYGHTLGHAIESYKMTLDSKQHLLHGEAIAIGLILETFISYKMFNFPLDTLDKLKSFVHQFYKFQTFEKQDQLEIIDLMKFDKKNVKNEINFVLLKSIGEPVLDCKVDNNLIFEAFDYYHSKI